MIRVKLGWFNSPLDGQERCFGVRTSAQFFMVACQHGPLSMIFCVLLFAVGNVVLHVFVGEVGSTWMMKLLSRQQHSPQSSNQMGNHLGDCVKCFPLLTRQDSERRFVDERAQKGHGKTSFTMFSMALGTLASLMPSCLSYKMGRPWEPGCFLKTREPKCSFLLPKQLLNTWPVHVYKWI